MRGPDVHDVDPGPVPPKRKLSENEDVEEKVTESPEKKRKVFDHGSMVSEDEGIVCFHYVYY